MIAPSVRELHPVERTDPESEGPPDRQFLLSFAADEPGDFGDNRAVATIHRPIDPTEWAGQCEPGTTLPLIGPVTAEDGCKLLIEQDQETAVLRIDTSEGMAAACFIPDSEAIEATARITLLGTHMVWGDVLTNADGSTEVDPPSPDATLTYELIRRTDPVEVPGE